MVKNYADKYFNDLKTSKYKNINAIRIRLYIDSAVVRTLSKTTSYTIYANKYLNCGAYVQGISPDNVYSSYDVCELSKTTKLSKYYYKNK